MKRQKGILFLLSETVESFICGSGSGLLSKLIIYPLDLTKKRLQVQGFEKAREQFGAVRLYTGMLHCIKDTVTSEGVLGLYKGLAPSLLKAVLTTGTIFCVYDQMCYLFSLRHQWYTTLIFITWYMVIFYHKTVLYLLTY